jgi:predicted DNA-binding transcriptional regulator
MTFIHIELIYLAPQILKSLQLKLDELNIYHLLYCDEKEIRIHAITDLDVKIVKVILDHFCIDEYSLEN